MRNKGFKGAKRLATTLLAALLLASMASAQTVGPKSFPGTGGAIAFSSTRDGFATFGIYRMNADGFGQTKLTDTPGVSFSPNWSADGKKIAFSNSVDLGVPGEKIAFTTERDGNAEIYRMRAKERT